MFLTDFKSVMHFKPTSQSDLMLTVQPIIREIVQLTYALYISTYSSIFQMVIFWCLTKRNHHTICNYISPCGIFHSTHL